MIKGLFRNISSYRGGKAGDFKTHARKAIYDGDTEIPKEKHVAYVMSAMQGSVADITPQEAIKYLGKHLRRSGTSWKKRMKVMYVFHFAMNRVPRTLQQYLGADLVYDSITPFETIPALYSQEYYLNILI